MPHSQVESGARERIRRLERHLARETRARQEVERLLEIKGLELHDLNRNMAKLNASLERQVEERTRELDRERQRAAELTQRDPLTGLANRFMFREHMEHVLPRIRRGSGVAVLYLDMDGFKGINDMLGHSA
ncbi:MAG TPA: diguanylate cyclase, partial [Acetobacteraceae bacterium]|nr:diguanylate cyclase [Acetobacteraceae bacterium]